MRQSRQKDGTWRNPQQGQKRDPRDLKLEWLQPTQPAQPAWLQPQPEELPAWPFRAVLKPFEPREPKTKSIDAWSSDRSYYKPRQSDPLSTGPSAVRLRLVEKGTAARPHLPAVETSHLPPPPPPQRKASSSSGQHDVLGHLPRPPPKPAPPLGTVPGVWSAPNTLQASLHSSTPLVPVMQPSPPAWLGEGQEMHNGMSLSSPPYSPTLPAFAEPSFFPGSSPSVPARLFSEGCGESLWPQTPSFDPLCAWDYRPASHPQTGVALTFTATRCLAAPLPRQAIAIPGPRQAVTAAASTTCVHSCKSVLHGHDGGVPIEISKSLASEKHSPRTEYVLNHEQTSESDEAGTDVPDIVPHWGDTDDEFIWGDDNASSAMSTLSRTLALSAAHEVVIAQPEGSTTGNGREPHRDELLAEDASQIANGDHAAEVPSSQPAEVHAETRCEENASSCSPRSNGSIARVLSRALAKAVLIEVYFVVASQQSVFNSTAPQVLMSVLAPPVTGMLASNDKSGSGLKFRKRRRRKAKKGAKHAPCELSEHSRDCQKEHGLALEHQAVHNHNVIGQSNEQKSPPLFKAGFLVFALLVAFVLRMPSSTPAQVPVGRHSRTWRTTAPGSAADASHSVDSIVTSMATTVAQVKSELEKQDEARVKRLQSRLLTHRQGNR